MKNAPLGQQSAYPDQYAPELLFPVARADNRKRLGLEDGAWPWFGEDRWQAFELSWLGPSGVPRVAIGDIRIPAVSANIIESKSLKLYCNSFNQTVLADTRVLVEMLERDLSRAADAAVSVTLMSVDEPVTLQGRPAGFTLLDDLPIKVHDYHKNAGLLRAAGQTAGPATAQQYCSHLLKSNCPVTGQPDWGSLFITLDGPAIDQEGLLAYIVGYRNTQDFHEHCVESIFTDLMQALAPNRLTVSAQYNRRGGLDINPWRSTEAGVAPAWRLSRQ